MIGRLALFAAFVALGVTAAAIPASLPAAEHSLGSAVLEAVPVLFAGLLIGVLVSGPAMRVMRSELVLVLGCTLQSGGLVAFALSPTPGLLVVGCGLAGFGFGLSEVSATLCAKQQAHRESAAISLSALTGAVAIAAACTPIVIVVASAVLEPRLMLIGVAVIPLATGALIYGKLHGQPRGGNGERAHRNKQGTNFRAYVTLAPFLLALPVYVGIETVFAGWSAVLPAALLRIDPVLAGLGTSAFWMLMALGRYAAVVMTTRGAAIGNVAVWGSSVGAVSLFVAAALAAQAPELAIAAVAIAVIAIAPSYGIIAGLALDRLTDAAAPDVLGVFVACGAVGGAVIPAAILLLARDPASGLTFAMCAGGLVAVAILMRMSPLFSVATSAQPSLPRRDQRHRLLRRMAPN